MLEGDAMNRPIVHEDIERYLHRIAPARGDVLAEMEREAERRSFPIIGPLVGRLLGGLARAAGARRVYEMGSGFGYSTCWFAEALGPDGRVWHTDGSAENSASARAYLEKAGLAYRVSFGIGDARELIASEEGPFDIVFCDIDKHQYPDVPGLALPRLREGGLLIFDNMLWYGRVADEKPETDDDRGVIELTRRLIADPSLDTSILPLRDGVSISVKLR
jgi:predicted O-methyltransferase YrrM